MSTNDAINMQNLRDCNPGLKIAVVQKCKKCRAFKIYKVGGNWNTCLRYLVRGVKCKHTWVAVHE